MADQIPSTSQLIKNAMAAETGGVVEPPVSEFQNQALDTSIQNQSQPSETAPVESAQNQIADPNQPAEPEQNQNTPNQEGSSEPQSPTPEDHSPSASANPLVDLLSQNGFENINDENAQSRLADALQEMSSLRDQADQVSRLQESMFQMQQQFDNGQQQATQPQAQDQGASNAPAIPSFRPEWNTYVDSETGMVNDTAPLEVRQAFQEVSDFRQRSITDPTGWFMEQLQAASADPRFTQILSPAVEPVIETQLGRQAHQQEADRQYSELQDVVFQKDPVTQKLRTDPRTGQPVYNEAGNQIYNAAIEDLSYYRNIPTSQVANSVSDQELISAMHRQMGRNSLQPQQPTPPPAAQPVPQQSVAEQRQQNQEALINENSFNSLQDPGGDRSGAVNSNGQGTAHLDSRQTRSARPASPRSLIVDAMKAQQTAGQY